MSDPAPLIVTLQLDDESFRFFTELRTQHFPPERNYLSAHVTLFHHLPGEERVAVEAELAAQASRLPCLELAFESWRFLGRGVAAGFSCPELESLHRRLSNAFAPWLTPQDKQKLRPHVTIQNKTDPVVAKALWQKLQSGNPPRAAQGKGLELWRYLGAPWEHLGEFPFCAKENAE